MRNRALAAPYVGWMALFVIAPLLMVVFYAFTSKDGGFTFQNFSNMGQYAETFTTSFALALVATLICILIGYPMAYFMARERGGFRRYAVMLIMLPMWMNFLLRTYSWMSLLENTGLLNRFFQAIGLIDLVNNIFGTSYAYFPMINTAGAVVLGMVYNFLPFMILPIHSVIERIDPKVIEAAQDLGANPSTIFRKVIFPLSLPGVLSGITMVFIPAVSTFVVSSLLGGGKIFLLGDLIELQFKGGAYNPHLGSAIALVMMVIVLIAMSIMNRFGEGEEGTVMF